MEKYNLEYSSDFLEKLYQTMVRIRLFEESLVRPILDHEIRTPCHLCSGQEGVAVGVCSALSKEDYIFGNHRSHGHFLAKGGSLKAMAAEIYCRESGCSRGRGGSMHLIDPEVGMLGSAPIVSGTISLGLGSALASLIRGDDRVTVVFFGDGATGEGVLYESLNFAALWKLPIIFVCENNFYATHMPVSDCRVQSKIRSIAEPFCVDNCEVDGNDVLAVFEEAKKAVEKCRRGEGPFFIECLTYRLRGHVGPDDNIQGLHTDIRPPAEVEVWRKRDPLVLFKDLLLRQYHIEEQVLRSIEAEVEAEIRIAHDLAKKSPHPVGKDLLNYVFR